MLTRECLVFAQFWSKSDDASSDWWTIVQIVKESPWAQKTKKSLRPVWFAVNGYFPFRETGWMAGNHLSHCTSHREVAAAIYQTSNSNFPNDVIGDPSAIFPRVANSTNRANRPVQVFFGKAREKLWHFESTWWYIRVAPVTVAISHHLYHCTEALQNFDPRRRRKWRTLKKLLKNYERFYKTREGTVFFSRANMKSFDFWDLCVENGITGKRLEEWLLASLPPFHLSPAIFPSLSQPPSLPFSISHIFGGFLGKCQ